MSKSYLNAANHHYEKIEYYYNHGGAHGYSQAIHHYHKLGECYSKAGRNHSGETRVLQDLYAKAGALMDEMKRREGTKTR